ncbi:MULTISPECIES: SEC-C metal-binding domain-containing protein [Clostridia]|uniref:SEC-C domain-containing protein n=2 Tax=Clostridia TaxID=186801 RepID=A0A8I0A5B1_9CLOT|nr:MULTISPECIES: SEC-C metal-binding domain-containing protein [Clostridia]MBC5639704.1 SEC-C domain-containing protein [Clostridium lentum]MBC5653937.1 SEC-C domain-containing protein [Blautia lenta]
MKDKDKLQEEILKADMKNVEKIWKESDGEQTLAALLEKMTKDELVKVAKKYDVKGITSLKKAEVVERIREVIIKNVDLMINSLEETSIKFLQELINYGGVKKYQCDLLINSNFLRNRGIVFTASINGELYVILPEELRVLLKEKITKDVMTAAREKSDLIKAIAGSTYYYGVVSYSAIREILESTFNTEVTDEKIKELVLIGEELGYDYVIEEDGLCHIDVENSNKIVKLQKKNKKNICKFDKKTLIKAGVPDFMEEHKSGKNLQRALGEMFIIDKEILKDEMDSFTISIKNEMPMEKSINLFLDAYEIDNEEEKNIFAYELEHLAKSIKRWSLNGYSENEITKLEQRVVNEVNIGRNDPCLCGSKKKYKKCCGR